MGIETNAFPCYTWLYNRARGSVRNTWLCNRAMGSGHKANTEKREMVIYHPNWRYVIYEWPLKLQI